MPEPGSDIVRVVHPQTGELFDTLDDQPGEVLADVLLALREHQTQVRQMERALEDELRRRLAGRDRVVHVFGEYEVDAKPTFARVWDAEDLEVVLRQLLDDGTVHAGELTEVIRHETVVSPREALALMNRLQGGAHERIEACFSWVKKGSKVHVARTAQASIPEEVT